MHDEMNEGRVLAGKYRVERVIGRGGMGVVVAAHHLQLDERVAIKLMLPEGLSSAEAVARFAREARAAVKIKSEHVARVSDVGVLENGAPFIVMEYLEGGDLSAWLAEHGRLSVEQAVEFLLQASEALAEAHSIGIIHRDLKPANLFVIRRPDGALSVKVLDFGISKVTGLSGSAPDFGMTKTSAMLGSPLYMSPEQMHSAKEAGVPSDIWALGAILYELLSGKSPFASAALPELVMKITSRPPPPITQIAPDIPSGLEAVILRCLEKEPSRRFRTIGELALALAEFAPRRSRISIERISGVLKEAGLPASWRAVPSSSQPTTRLEPATASSWGQTAAPMSLRGRRAVLTTGVVLSLGGLAAAGFALHGRDAVKTAPSSDQNSIATGASPSTPTASAGRSPPSETAPAPVPVVSAVSPPETNLVPVATPARVPANKPNLPARPKPAAPAPASAVVAAPKPKPAPAHPNSVFDDR